MADHDTDLFEFTTEIVAALVGKNDLAASELLQLIKGVHQALSDL